MVLIRKTCLFRLIRCYEVTSHSLFVKIISASNQHLEIAFVYNPNNEIEKIRNLKAAVTHLADNGCTNQLIIGDYNSGMDKDLVYVSYTGLDPHHTSRYFLFGHEVDDVIVDVCRFLLLNFTEIHF